MSFSEIYVKLVQPVVSTPKLYLIKWTFYKLPWFEEIYGWYQTQFYFKARELHSNFGDDFLRLFRDFLIDTNPDIIGELDNAELNQHIRDTFGKEAAEIMKWKSDSWQYK